MRRAAPKDGADIIRQGHQGLVERLFPSEAPMRPGADRASWGPAAPVLATPEAELWEGSDTGLTKW
jgi:hypothetical protein